MDKDYYFIENSGSAGDGWEKGDKLEYKQIVIHADGQPLVVFFNLDSGRFVLVPFGYTFLKE